LKIKYKFYFSFSNFGDFIFQKSLNLQQKYLKENFNSTEIWHQKKKGRLELLGRRLLKY